MTVKVLLLKTGQYLISEIEERPDEEPDCILINPKVVIGFIPDFVMENFVPYSHQKQIPIRSTDIITIVDPMDSLLKLYNDAIT
jgi:hypothetical protein